MYLTELPIGIKAKIIRVEYCEDIFEYLLSIGFTVGETVKVIKKTSVHSLVVIVGNATFALRNDEAKYIEVE
jgi:Fe2+ transport system protein FeoA